MSTKTIELYTCDDCKHVILLGRGGIHISCSGSDSRITAKWAGGFEEHGKVAKGHQPPPYPSVKSYATGPFEGLDTQGRTVTICRGCLAKRLGFKDDSGVPEEPLNPDAPDRFNHREPV